MNLAKLYEVNIPRKKITDYLLSSTHLLGKNKAAYFSKYGFYAENPEIFTAAIHQLVIEFDIQSVSENKYGKIYIVDGNLKTPSKKLMKARSVWIVLKNQETATLITIYPL